MKTSLSLSLSLIVGRTREGHSPVIRAWCSHAFLRTRSLILGWTGGWTGGRMTLLTMIVSIRVCMYPDVVHLMPNAIFVGRAPLSELTSSYSHLLRQFFSQKKRTCPSSGSSSSTHLSRELYRFYLAFVANRWATLAYEKDPHFRAHFKGGWRVSKFSTGVNKLEAPLEGDRLHAVSPSLPVQGLYSGAQFSDIC